MKISLRPVANCFALLSTVLLAAGTAAEVQARPSPVSLSPVSPWNLHATDAGCALRRAFGDAKRPLIIQMYRFAPGDRFDVIVSGDEMSGLSRGPLQMRYGDLPPQPAWPFQTGKSERPGGKSVDTIFISSSLAPTRDFSGQDLVTPAMEEQARTISIVTSGRHIVLESGSLGKPMAALRGCVNDLVASWGLDEQVQTTLSRKARPVGQAKWARSIQADYPSELAVKGKQARVNLRMLLDSQGHPTDCKVFLSHNDPKFDEIACKNMMKFAKFEPALDAAGQPVASYYATMIMWIFG